jgi:hypothetical protein
VPLKYVEFDPYFCRAPLIQLRILHPGTSRAPGYFGRAVQGPDACNGSQISKQKFHASSPLAGQRTSQEVPEEGGSCAKPTPPTRERAQCCDGGPAGRPGHPSARARAPGQRAREAREPLLRGGGRGAAGCRAHQVVPARVRLRVCAGALASMRMRVRACAPQRSRPLSAPAALVCAGMEGAPGVCEF